MCPSIPGYCAQGFLNIRCTFDCVTGPDIDSICTQDGTWAPYPTCQGDLRETRDGCRSCPGPVGGLRNRTAEAILNKNSISTKRVPKVIVNNQSRKNVPSFAGNINIGQIIPQENPTKQKKLSSPIFKPFTRYPVMRPTSASIPGPRSFGRKRRPIQQLRGFRRRSKNRGRSFFHQKMNKVSETKRQNFRRSQVQRDF